MTEPAASRAPVARVSSLELFFDLVFVFTITQVTHLVEHAHGPFDYLRAFLVLAVVWWMYGGYAWLTSNVGTDRAAYRLLMLCGMAGFLVMALRLPAVSGEHGIAFGVAYLVVVLVHALLFTHAPNTSARAIRGVLPFNLLIGVLVVVSGVVRASWNWMLWLAAGGAILLVSALRRERGFQLSPSHFAERNGLVVLIALGESVVAIGNGAADLPLQLAVLTAVVLALALAAAIWWSYFDRDDARAEHALAGAAGEGRAHLALYAYYHAHLVMIAGIVVTAAGVHELIADVAHPAPASAALLLASGVALYLVGESAFRRLLRIGPVGVRLVTAALIVASSLVGIRAGGLAQLALVTGLVVGALLVEQSLGDR